MMENFGATRSKLFNKKASRDSSREASANYHSNTLVNVNPNNLRAIGLPPRTASVAGSDIS